MIITTAKEINDEDVARACWSRLRRFHNISFLRDHIIETHQTADTKAKENAKAQAENIRFCLTQAREYAEAATSASLATQPNLLYYAAMSMAIAEILYKQFPDMHLAKMRAQHAHHGLEFKIERKSDQKQGLRNALQSMKAAPVRRQNGSAFGTFALWLKSAREAPAVGPCHTQPPTGYSTTLGVVYGASDMELSPLPASGVSLLCCFSRLEPLQYLLSTNGIASSFTRAACQLTRKLDNTIEIKFRFQPGPATPSLVQGIKARPQDFECIHWRPFSEDDLSIGGDLIISLRPEDNFKLELPHCHSVRPQELNIWPEMSALNEFGIYYVGAFMLGNYCRYFPDMWHKDVERTSPIAQAAEQFLTTAQERLPLLILNELSRTYFVPAAHNPDMKRW